MPRLDARQPGRFPDAPLGERWAVRPLATTATETRAQTWLPTMARTTPYCRGAQRLGQRLTARPFDCHDPVMSTPVSGALRCPNCGSNNWIYDDGTLPSSTPRTKGMYGCSNCGHYWRELHRDPPQSHEDAASSARDLPNAHDDKSP